MSVSFHEDMHFEIWEWIREWCERRGHTRNSQLPQTPGDVLKWLIWKIGECDSEDSLYPFIREGGEEEWRGSSLFKFAEKMCEVGQRLYDDEAQGDLTWRTMKGILEYYLKDITQYIERINSLEWTSHQINNFFELGIDWHSEPVGHLTIDEFCNMIIWDRYITGDKVWGWSVINQRFHGYSLLDGLNDLSRSWAYWVREHLTDNILAMLSGMERGEEDDSYDSDEGLEEAIQQSNRQVVATTELTEQQKKKNDALRKLQETFDEVQEDLGDGLYLQMMNLMNPHYVVSS
jgi:hypothetical protein